MYPLQNDALLENYVIHELEVNLIKNSCPDQCLEIWRLKLDQQRVKLKGIKVLLKVLKDLTIGTRLFRL